MCGFWLVGMLTTGSRSKTHPSTAQWRIWLRLWRDMSPLRLSCWILKLSAVHPIWWALVPGKKQSNLDLESISSVQYCCCLKVLYFLGYSTAYFRIVLHCYPFLPFYFPSSQFIHVGFILTFNYRSCQNNKLYCSLCTAQYIWLQLEQCNPNKSMQFVCAKT